MSITVDVKPEVEAELSRQAAACGIDLSIHAARVLESAVHIHTNPGILTEEQLAQGLRELSQFAHKIPALPDEAFSRESLYQDHD